MDCTTDDRYMVPGLFYQIIHYLRIFTCLFMLILGKVRLSKPQWVKNEAPQG